MPIAGRLGDMFGKQRVLVGSAVLLLAGRWSAPCPTPLLPMLAGRALQGLAMGFIPVGISLMREVVPPAMATTAVAAMSATLGVGGAIGLPLSAWIAETFDWHALFWVPAGLAVAGRCSASSFLVPTCTTPTRGRFDVVGAVGLAVGLVAALVGVSKGNDVGLGPRPHARAASRSASSCCWPGAGYELRQDEPLCDLRVTAQPPGAAHQPRRHRDRLRDDGPGDRRPPAAADARRRPATGSARRCSRPGSGWPRAA